MGLVGKLRKLLRSVLPVRRKAWRMVSMLRSPPGAARFCGAGLLGLPSGLRGGLISSPLMLPGLLVGGLVPGPWLETGERTGEGDWFSAAEANEVKPAMWALSLEPTGPPIWLLCSACTTSANEMKDSRRTSAESREP